MNDNDADDLARTLYGSGVDCGQCAVFGWGKCSMCVINAKTVAAAVLASGVVVSARDVKALADRLDAWGAYREAARHLRSLLREPATDAAPTGEQR